MKIPHGSWKNCLLPKENAFWAIFGITFKCDGVSRCHVQIFKFLFPSWFYPELVLSRTGSIRVCAKINRTLKVFLPKLEICTPISKIMVMLNFSDIRINSNYYFFNFWFISLIRQVQNLNLGFHDSWKISGKVDIFWPIENRELANMLNLSTTYINIYFIFWQLTILFLKEMHLISVQGKKGRGESLLSGS